MIHYVKELLEEGRVNFKPEKFALLSNEYPAVNF